MKSLVVRASDIIGQFFNFSTRIVRSRGYSLFVAGFFGLFCLAQLCPWTYRAFKNSGLGTLTKPEDLPILGYFSEHYREMWVVLAALGVGLAFALWFPIFFTKDAASRAKFRRRMPFFFTIFILFVIFRQYFITSPVTWPDWAALLGLAISAAFWTRTRLRAECEAPFTSPMDLSAVAFAPRPSLILVLGAFAGLLSALPAHVYFFTPDTGVDSYPRFFIGGAGGEEYKTAIWVCLGYSMLFAVLSALGGILYWAVYRFSGRVLQGGDQMRRRSSAVVVPAVIGAGAWALALTVPWQTRLWSDIRTLGYTSVMMLVLFGIFTALAPFFAITAQWVRISLADTDASDERPQPYFPSEVHLFTLLLFPIYWLLPALTFYRRRPLLVVAFTACAGVIGGGIWLTNYLLEGMKRDDFFDFKSMFESGELPFLRIWFSLMGVFLALAVGRRIRLHWLPAPPRFLLRWGVRLAALAVLFVAAVPFWSGRVAGMNVMARLNEFNSRHIFEADLLRKLTDFDRDGYSALFNGPDADDFDPHVGPLGMRPLRREPLASDVVSIADEEKARNAPNLVLLFLEGVPPKFLSCGGCSLPTTPNIDEIAKDGAYFTRAYSQYPSTWDAHLTVMSGRFLKLSEYFWNNRFIGKYSPHNNLQKAVNLLGLEHNCHAKSAAATQYMVPPDSPGFFDNDEITDPIPLADGAADDFGARMESFVRELPPGGRFFIWEHMDVTHFPWKERPGFEHLKGKGYAVEQRFRQTVGHMDAQVGRLLKALKDTGVYERTAIVIVGDHGCEFYKHTKCYYTTKLYEESLLVPLIVRIPGVTDGRCVAAPVTHRDLLPTLFELFGVQTEKPLEGVSFLPLLKPETPDEEAARSEERLRNRDLLLLTHYDYFGVLSNFHWKLIFDRPRGAWLMFDLQNDPDEMTNIADAQPGKFQELRQKMIALIYAHPYVTAGLLFPDELTDPTREWR